MGQINNLQENEIPEPNIMSQIADNYASAIKEPDYTVDEIGDELKRVNKRKKNYTLAKRIIFSLITVSSISVLVAVLFLPILQIYGNSMNTTLYEGNVVVSVKGAKYKRGDIISFYYNNTILVKRVIATAGEWVDIDEYGNVSVDGELLEEPYVTELSLGDCDITLPYQVPDNHIFVMGDHRSTSKDSRNRSMGPIAKEKVVGKIIFRIWPLSGFGEVK